MPGIGTYGFAARLYPQGVSGTTNNYTDAAVDAQIEHHAGTGTKRRRSHRLSAREQVNTPKKTGKL